MLVEVLTDNRNRTGAEVRNIFTKNGGSMAEPGAVAWQFERKGIVLVDRRADEDDLMLAGARRRRRGHRDDGRDLADHHPARPTCTPCAPRSRRRGMPVESADLTMLPTTTVPLDTPRAAKKVLGLIDALEDHDDVQDVYANFDIPAGGGGGGGGPPPLG